MAHVTTKAKASMLEREVTLLNLLITSTPSQEASLAEYQARERTMRALLLAFTISSLSFLSEYLLDTAISLNIYRLYRDIMIALLIVHFWDLYAEKEAERLLREMKDEAHDIKEE